MIKRSKNNSAILGDNIIEGNIGCNDGGTIVAANNSGDVDIIDEKKKQIIGGNIGWNKNKGKIRMFENEGLINRTKGHHIGYKKHY